jgi:hypothetical protein
MDFGGHRCPLLLARPPFRGGGVTGAARAGRGRTGRPDVRAILAGGRLSEGQAWLLAQLAASGIAAGVEYRALPPRRWRWDLCIPREHPWLLVEVHGGVWTGGHHGRGKGLTDDLEKQNSAVARGFVCLSVTTGQVEDGSALRWIRETMATRPATPPARDGRATE